MGSQLHSQVYCLAPLLSILYPVVPSNIVIEKRRLLLLSKFTQNTKYSLVTLKCKPDVNIGGFQLLGEVISSVHLSRYNLIVPFLIPGMTVTSCLRER